MCFFYFASITNIKTCSFSLVNLIFLLIIVPKDVYYELEITDGFTDSRGRS